LIHRKQFSKRPKAIPLRILLEDRETDTPEDARPSQQGIHKPREKGALSHVVDTVQFASHGSEATPGQGQREADTRRGSQ
jgi:hypothetical protein